jgi:hypothetical protein
MAAAGVRNTKAIVETFFRKDSELVEESKKLKPIKSERKELYDTLVSVLEQSDVKEHQLPTGQMVSLEIVERPVPLKKDYIQAKLHEILGNAEQAELLANRIWDERPTQSKPKLKIAGKAGAGRSRKRERAERE